MLDFDICHTDGKARLGRLSTAHGEVATPLLMPCGTVGAVRGITPAQLRDTGTEMVLANAYHLMLRPGAEVVAELGGLHRLMAWPGPILTDSGGYQVLSLADRRTVTDQGVTFRSHIDGALVELTPERCMEVQWLLGADIVMQLDECPPASAGRDQLAAAVRRSAEWARRCKAAWEARGRSARAGHPQGLFGIQQGSVDPGIRRRCSEQLASMPFDGYAIGGLAVGEPSEVLHEAVDFCAPMLPTDRPRYLMGVGYPEDLLHAVSCGVDLFDCVLPTRSARTGKAFTSRGEIVIKNARWADDDSPLDPDCKCPTCRRYSKGTLRHFFISREVTSVVLLTVHNLYYFLSLMRGAREAIMAGRYGEYRERFQSIREMGHTE